MGLVLHNHIITVSLPKISLKFSLRAVVETCGSSRQQFHRGSPGRGDASIEENMTISRFTQSVIFFFVLGVALLAQGNTNTTVTIKTGLSQAIVDGGCDVGWLAQVMADNNVGPEKLRILPAGSVYVVPENCETAPAPAIAKLSRLIMNADRKFGRAISADEGKKLKGEIRSLTLSRTDLKAQVDDLTKQLVDLIAQLKEAKEGRGAKSRNIPLVALTFFLGVFALCLGVGLYLNNRQLVAKTQDNKRLTDALRALSEVPPVIQYEIGNGETVTFTRVADAEDVVPHTCSLCGPEKPPIEKHNIPRHLRRAHAFDVNAGVGVEPDKAETV